MRDVRKSMSTTSTVPRSSTQVGLKWQNCHKTVKNSRVSTAPHSGINLRIKSCTAPNQGKTGIKTAKLLKLSFPPSGINLKTCDETDTSLFTGALLFSHQAAGRRALSPGGDWGITIRDEVENNNPGWGVFTAGTVRGVFKAGTVRGVFNSFINPGWGVFNSFINPGWGVFKQEQDRGVFKQEQDRGVF